MVRLASSRTVPVRPDAAARAAIEGADAVTFTSSSTVTNFCDAVGREGVPPVVASIGPVTSATARDLGLHVTTEADPHTIDGLVDALVAALEQWPAQGVPENPGAWLASTARRRAIDLIRREQTFARKAEQVGHEEATRTAPDAAEVVVDPTRAVGDDVLALLFATCHPLLARESRVALTLRLFGGLTTDEIAATMFVSVNTVRSHVRSILRKLGVTRRNQAVRRAWELQLLPPRDAA